MFANVKVMDSEAQGSVNTFVGRGVGHMLLVWANKLYPLAKEVNGDKFEVVTPSLSLPVESTVSL
ncbi:MAG: sulfate transporter subunit, partial [Nitrosospira sp.]